MLNKDEIIERDKTSLDNFIILHNKDSWDKEWLKLNNAKKRYLEYQLEFQHKRRKYDLSKAFCPSCAKNHFYLYNVTDDNDTYAGLRCQSCKFDYSFTH